MRKRFIFIALITFLLTVWGHNALAQSPIELYEQADEIVRRAENAIQKKNYQIAVEDFRSAIERLRSIKAKYSDWETIELVDARIDDCQKGLEEAQKNVIPQRQQVAPPTVETPMIQKAHAVAARPQEIPSQEIELLKEQIAHLNRRLKDTEDELEGERRNSAKISAAIRSLEQERDSLAAKIELGRQRVETSGKAEEELQQKLEDMMQKFAAKEADYQQRINKLEADLRSVKTQLGEYQKTDFKVDEELVKFKKDAETERKLIIDNFAKERELLQNQIKALSQAIKRLEDENRDLRKRTAETVAKVPTEDIQKQRQVIEEQFAKERKSSKDQIDSLTKANKVLEEDNKRLSKNIEELKAATKAPTESPQLQASKLTKENERLKQELETIVKSHKELEKQNTSLKSEELTAKLKKAEEANINLGKKVMRAAFIEDKMDSMEKELEGLNKQLGSLKLENETAHKEIARLQTELKKTGEVKIEEAKLVVPKEKEKEVIVAELRKFEKGAKKKTIVIDSKDLKQGSIIPSEYIIHPNDMLEITVYDEPDLTKTARVTQEGNISFPLVGDVKAAGLTASQLAAGLGTLLEKDYIINPQVTVLVTEYGRISVLGQVRLPGSYQLKGNLTVVEAIAIAGGFTNVANPNGTKIVRVDEEGNKWIIKVRIHDITDRGDKSKDVLLRPNDIIIVPESFF